MHMKYLSPRGLASCRLFLVAPPSPQPPRLFFLCVASLYFLLFVSLLFPARYHPVEEKVFILPPSCQRPTTPMPDVLMYVGVLLLCLRDGHT